MTMTASPTIDAPTDRRPAWQRWLPVAVLAAGIALFFLLGGHRLVSFETLRDHRAALHQFVTERSVLAALAYIAIYVVGAALSIPGGAVLTVAGGFLFGTVLGSLYVVIGATIGATLVFLIARSAIGASIGARIGPTMQRMEAGFRENAFSYLLVLRLVPLFPFWLVNLVPALLGVSTRTFILATLIGIIPGSLVFASVGSGLDSVFASGQDLSAQTALTGEVAVALIGLALLALVPVFYRHIKRRGR